MSNEVTRDSDERGRRWYHSNNKSVMSVTTVLQYLDEDTTGLQWWRQNNQGGPDSFHYEHVWWYSGPRGTLTHWRCLDPLADRDLWGEEEKKSLKALTDGPQDGEFDDASYGMSDILFSALKNKDSDLGRDEVPNDESFTSVMMRDVEWADEKFTELCRPLGIHKGAVIAVEQYLLNHKQGFGGQCDLLYESPSGETVLADLKTSSGLRQKHVVQAYAYAMAVEQDPDLPSEVDRCEIIRLSADNKEVKVHSSERPLHVPDNADWFTTDNWFEDQYGDYSYDGREDIEDEFQACIQQAYGETEY